MIEKYPIPPPVRDFESEHVVDPSKICYHERGLRCLVCKNGTRQYRYQCIKCGKGLEVIPRGTLSPKEIDDAPPFDQDLANSVRETAWERQRNKWDRDYRQRWDVWYREYLRSDVWAKRRKAVFERSGEKCEACGSAHAEQIHHTTYAHVGAEPLWELRAVCCSCHLQL